MFDPAFGQFHIKTWIFDILLVFTSQPIAVGASLLSKVYGNTAVYAYC